MRGRGARLYWRVQWRRNDGLGALFLVLVLFAILYAILFPGILAIGAASKFVQGWFPTAMVAAAQTIVMLTGGIDLSVGPMVSLGWGRGGLHDGGAARYFSAAYWRCWRSVAASAPSSARSWQSADIPRSS